MLHTAKANSLKMQVVLYGLVFVCAFAVLSASAQAQCSNWDASGTWKIIQRGQDHLLKLNLKQDGTVLTGTANTLALTPGESGSFDGYTAVTGTVDGTIEGDKFSVQIFWPDNLTGVYNAKVLPSGRLDGETYDKNNSKIRQPWHSEGVLKCAPPVEPPAAPPTPSRPPKSSGKMRVEPPPMKAPWIAASALVFPAPNFPTGTVVLTWDGGPDHPYAEVWVKVDDGDETFVVEQAKGSRQIEVERGKADRRYLYILTDDGKTLAMVGFVVQHR